MGHAPTTKSVYRFAFSFVAALLFVVGMATPASALHTQPTRGAITTGKATGLYPRIATVPTTQNVYACDDCGSGMPAPPTNEGLQAGGWLNNNPTYKKNFLDPLGRETNGLRIHGQLQRIFGENQRLKNRFGEGQLPALVPRLSEDQKDALRNESRSLNRAGLAMGVGGGLMGLAEPPVGVAIGTIGAMNCWKALDIDECLQKVETYQRIQNEQKAGLHQPYRKP